jgi:hypothetical protein
MPAELRVARRDRARCQVRCRRALRDATQTLAPRRRRQAGQRRQAFLEPSPPVKQVRPDQNSSARLRAQGLSRSDGLTLRAGCSSATRLFSESHLAAPVDAGCPAAQAWTRGCASTPCCCLGNSACGFPIVSLELAGHPVDSGAAESGCRAPARCPMRSADASREPLPSGGDRKPRGPRCCQEHGPNALLAARAAPHSAHRHSRARDGLARRACQVTVA